MKLEMYKNNSKDIKCTFTTDKDLSGFTAYFTATKSATDTTPIISASTTVDSENKTAVISLKPSDTDIDAGDYVYDITLSNSTDNYTVAMDKLQIIENVKY